MTTFDPVILAKEAYLHAENGFSHPDKNKILEQVKKNPEVWLSLFLIETPQIVEGAMVLVWENLHPWGAWALKILNTVTQNTLFLPSIAMAFRSTFPTEFRSMLQIVFTDDAIARPQREQWEREAIQQQKLVDDVVDTLMGKSFLRNDYHQQPEDIWYYIDILEALLSKNPSPLDLMETLLQHAIETIQTEADVLFVARLWLTVIKPRIPETMYREQIKRIQQLTADIALQHFLNAEITAANG
jgi:hypothetical protein